MDYETVQTAGAAIVGGWTVLNVLAFMGFGRGVTIGQYAAKHGHYPKEMFQKNTERLWKPVRYSLYPAIKLTEILFTD